MIIPFNSVEKFEKGCSYKSSDKLKTPYGHVNGVLSE